MISLLAYDPIESEQLLNADAKKFNQIVNADFFLNSVLPEVLAHNPHVDVKLIDVDMDFSYLFNKNCADNLIYQVRSLIQRKAEFIASVRIKTSCDQCEVFGLAFYQKDRENTLSMERVSIDADNYDNRELTRR